MSISSDFLLNVFCHVFNFFTSIVVTHGEVLCLLFGCGEVKKFWQAARRRNSTCPDASAALIIAPALESFSFFMFVYSLTVFDDDDDAA